MLFTLEYTLVIPSEGFDTSVIVGFHDLHFRIKYIHHELLTLIMNQ